MVTYYQKKGGKNEMSHNDRMLEAIRYLCRPSGPALCLNRATQSRLLRATSRRLLKLSEDGDPEGHLLQCSITLMVNQQSLILDEEVIWNILQFH